MNEVEDYDQRPILFVWKDRAVKFTNDGLWIMSRRGCHEDFDTAPERPDGNEAVAGTLPNIIRTDGEGKLLPSTGRVCNLRKLDEDRILIVGDDRSLWLLVEDPCRGGRIEPVVGCECPVCKPYLSDTEAGKWRIDFANPLIGPVCAVHPIHSEHGHSYYVKRIDEL